MARMIRDSSVDRALRAILELDRRDRLEAIAYAVAVELLGESADPGLQAVSLEAYLGALAARVRRIQEAAEPW